MTAINNKKYIAGLFVYLLPFLFSCSPFGGTSSNPAVASQQQEVRVLEAELKEAEQREKAAKARLKAARYELKALKSRAKNRGY